jgi:hypothetical protein
VDEKKRSTDPMTLWRRTRSELAGAWRSLRYDLGRRTEQSPPPAGPAPDVTSTGMSTFGGVTGHTGPAERYAEPARPRRRLAAAAAFVALAVAGSAGSYLAVVTGFGGLLHGDSAAAGERPLAAAGRTGDAAATGADATSGLGRGPAAAAAAAAPDVTTAQPVPPQRAAAPATEPPAAGPAQPPRQPVRAGTPTREDCDCLSPPVPTPTAPPSAGPSPTPGDSASPSPSESESSDPGDPSADPTASGDDAGETRSGHRRQ